MDRHRTPMLATLCCVALALPAAGQTAFEGIATFKNSYEGKSMETKYYTKGSKVRQEMSLGGQTAVTITDYSAARTITLMPSQKKYMVMDLKAMAESVKPLVKDTPAPDKPVELPHITATGNKETIAGRTCEHYIMATGNGELDMCAAKGMGNFNAFAGAALARSGGSDNPQYRDILKAAKDGFFPLKTTMKDKSGKILFTSEAVAIEPKALPADMFEPPPGFTEFKMPSIPGLPKRP